MSSLNDKRPLAVPVKDQQRVLLLEVLPLDQAARPHLLDAVDECIDEVVVSRTTKPGRAMPEVERIVEEALVVGADIERDRQRQRRVDPARRCVQRELADRDRHAAGALVAQPQDPLVVGHDDQANVLVRAVAEDVRNPVAVGRRDPRAARPAEDVAELLAGAADGGRIDDRQKLLEVLSEEPVEEGRVAILERGQADVLLERIDLDPQVLQLQRDLFLDGQGPGRQEPRRPNASRSSSGKARSFVNSRLPRSADPARPMLAGRPAAMSSNGAGGGRMP
jgi:hypothetical protein